MDMRTDPQPGRSLLQLFDELFDHAPLLVDAFDKEGRCILWNQECARVFGWSAEEIKTHPNPLALFYPHERQYRDVVGGIASHSGEMFREWHPCTRDGRQLTTMWANIPLPNGDMLCIGHDLTEQRLVENQQRLAAHVFESSYAGIMITDAGNRICDVNPAFTRITGYSRAEVIGQDPMMLDSGQHDRRLYARIWRRLVKHDGWKGELWGRRKGGEVYPQHLSVSVVRDAGDQVLHYVIIFSDITQLKRHEDELKYLARHDVLTKVPNRLHFSDRLEVALERARRENGMLAVCYLDLDGFKPINDRFGHAAGDEVLIEVSERLHHVIRTSDLLARLGGDEFAVLLSDLHDTGECLQIIERMQKALTRPIAIGDSLARISASIGVTLFPHDNVDAEILLRHADQAMYRAKHSGKNGYHIFDPSQGLPERRNQQRVELALKNDEFVLYYQPKVDLSTGETQGFEALLRWQHPQHGLLVPEDFLPMMLNTRLESTLGEWVIDRALRQIDDWQRHGWTLSVSVNVSANHLILPGFGDSLKAALARYPQVPGNLLELEFRDGTVVEDILGIKRSLTYCRELGLSVTLDDFGTGYSSLAHLRELPIDTIKIDSRFVGTLLVDERDAMLVEGIIRIARMLDCAVIAEGAESVAHCERLRQLGCLLAQGYGIAPPMPADRVPLWLSQRP